VQDVAVIAEPKAAEVALDPIRARLLAALVEPGSATSLATQVGLSRQKVNYHLRALERHGLVELVEERRKGNCIERVMQATARSYVVAPSALPAAADTGPGPDRLSAQWVIALASRLVGDVGALIAGAERTHRRVSTFAIDGEIRFASAADRVAFSDELSEAVAELVARYHHEGAPHGRDHRLVIAVHPAVPAAPAAPPPPADQAERG
jgi:DNA-binding transcriptional ArsR family regulator